jgi:cysteine synthase
MAGSTIERDIVDRGSYDRAVTRFREAGVVLPRLSELADPGRIIPGIRAALAGVDPDAAHPLNLFRVHWMNDRSRRAPVGIPEHVVLPSSITGVEAPIVVTFGDRFPLIRAHKVLAAYACLVPRIVSGLFDPTTQRAVWPSTGNYCRGGVAISRILGCRGVAVLPEGMSAERFRWLERWVEDPSDIVRTPGSESNVKEIYDACAGLARDPANVILNQFSEFGNHLAHYLCTGHALAGLFEALQDTRPGLRLAAFVSATGSAGTIGAGDLLKERYGARIVAAEALECPTLLENGYGAHNIQGIGDKHVPLIHNVMNTDIVTAVSDRSTDELNVLFNTRAGRDYLVRERKAPPAVVETLSSFGLSSICNVLAAVKVARRLALGPADAVFTVATDGAELYASERAKTESLRFADRFDAVRAGETFGEHVLGATDDHLIELGFGDRNRIFNLGYFTWVEQQGVPVADFEARRSQDFWVRLRERIPIWDGMIEEFNRRVGVTPRP